MSIDNIDTEIRKALDARANDIVVPDTLAERTLAVARDQAPQPLWGRLKGWRDSRRMRARPSGYPRVLYVAGAAGTAVLLFAVGTFVTMPRGGDEKIRATSREETPELRDSARDEVDRRVGERGRVVLDLPAKSDANATSDESAGDPAAGQVGGVVSSGDASVDSTSRGNTSADVDVETGDGNSFIGLTGGTTTAVQKGDGVLAPKLVRAADIQVAVREFDAAWDKANDIANRNGDVVKSETKQIGRRNASGTVTMRVPSSKLDATIEDLRDLGTLARLETTGDDIAKRVDDVSDRVRQASKKEDELGEAQKSAPTISQRNELGRQLEHTRRQLKELRKKRAIYEDKVRYSIVRATIRQSSAAASSDSMLGTATHAAGRVSLAILSGILVLLAALLPLAALTVAIWFVVRTVRRRRPGTE